MPNDLPLTSESQLRLEPVSFERNKFITKSPVPAVQEQAMMEGVAQSQIDSSRAAQDLISRKQELENQRQFQEQQLRLERERIREQQREAQASAWSQIPLIGPIIGALKD